MDIDIQKIDGSKLYIFGTDIASFFEKNKTESFDSLRNFSIN